jgi:hypothetical protein
MPLWIIMANANQPVVAGGYYSGANPIPTVQEFIEKLDITKNERDKKIDAAEKKPKGEDVKKVQEHEQRQQQTTNRSSTPQLVAGRHQKIVTDPVTGKQVVIEHAKKEGVRDVRNPKVNIAHGIVVSAKMHLALRSECEFRKGNSKKDLQLPFILETNIQ